MMINMRQTDSEWNWFRVSVW